MVKILPTRTPEFARRDAILRAVSQATERFLRNSPSEDEFFNELIDLLGRAAEISRMYIFENFRGEDGETWAGQRYEWVESGATSEMENPVVAALPYKAGGMGRWEQLLRKNKFVQGHVRDFPPGEREILEPQGIASIVIVPVFVGGAWWGFMGFDECCSERGWAPVELEALRTAAALVGAVIERRRMDEALKESEERFRNLSDLSYESIVLTNSGRIVEANRAAGVTFGYGHEELLGLNLDEVLRPIETAANEEDRNSASDETVEALGVRKDGDAFPVEIRSSEIPYRGETVTVWAIRDVTETKRYQEQLLSHREKLRRMGSELTLAEERERRRLAMDLHDHIGQCLALAKLKLGVLRNNLKTNSLDDIIGLVDDMSRDVRSLTLEISPPILYDLGLEPAIEWLTEEFQRRFGQRIDYKVAAWSEPGSLDIKVLLFRAVHELLMNVVKHARAEYAGVKLDLDGANVRIDVVDDGQGFIFGSGGKSNPNLGFGLFTVRERLAAVGGQFEIRSEPEKGTLVVLRAPMD